MSKRQPMRKRTRKDFNLQILNDYMAEHPGDVVDTDALYDWAKAQKRWEASPRNERSEFKEEIRRAASGEMIVDPQQRHVRKKHAVVLVESGKTRSFWGDIFESPVEHMQLAFQQRRRGIVGEAKQTKTDVDSYNDNNKDGHRVDMIWDLTEDLIESDLPIIYPDSPSDDDDDDDSER